MTLSCLSVLFSAKRNIMPEYTFRPWWQALATAFLLLTSVVSSAECTVAANGLNFGSYDVFTSGHTDSTGTVTVSCTVETPYTLKLSAGNGTFSERRLVSGSHNLNYNLYTDAARSLVWGDGSGGSVTVGGNTDTSAEHTVYGRIPARQNVYSGSYLDSIVVTLEY